MQEIKTAKLSPRQREEVEELLSKCRLAHPLRLSFPYEDADVFYLLYDRRLVCALALIMPRNPDSDEPAELSAFTRPSCRRRGYFTRLFDAASEHFEELDLIFLADGSPDSDPDTLKALEALGAEPAGNEYRMECDLTKAFPCPADTRSESENTGTDAPFTFIVTEENDSLRYTFYLGNEAAALCKTSGGASAACFYDFSVREDLRGRGLGRKALFFVMQYLRGRGCSRLFLHVSGENAPAVSLYKKTGFRITETLSYYMY